jgi:hypothetical protein
VNKHALYERYRQLDWPQQLGNLASTLARISTRASSSQYDALVADLLREAALFIEWSAKGVPQALLLDLAPLQRELLLWHRVWPQEALRPLLALQAHHLSDRLLRLAQLMPGA